MCVIYIWDVHKNDDDMSIYIGLNEDMRCSGACGCMEMLDRKERNAANMMIQT